MTTKTEREHRCHHRNDFLVWYDFIRNKPGFTNG